MTKEVDPNIKKLYETACEALQMCYDCPHCGNIAPTPEDLICTCKTLEMKTKLDKAYESCWVIGGL